MTMLIGEMVGCLIVAAGIGAIVGWLLRQLSVSSLNQHIYDVTTALQIKEQALHSAQLELKAKTSTIQIYENKITASEALLQAAQEESAAGAERVTQAQAELAAAIQRLSTLESEQNLSLQRFKDSDAIIAAFEQEARQANAARTAAQQELALKEEELSELQTRLEEMESHLDEMERLKSQIAELEPAQGRVHWLEVQLSEKDVQHRAALHDSEEARAALRDRLNEMELLQRQLQEKAEALHDSESKYNKALKQHATDAGIMEKQRMTIKEIESTLVERDKSLKEKDVRLGAMQQQLNEAASLHAELAKKEEEISRLRKRLVEVRAALRVQGESVDTASSHSGGKGPETERTKSANEGRKDDLKKIRGISPGYERVLNRMGTYTFIQIAKWTQNDIMRVAQQLETAPDRIRRDDWIGAAKKQHREKYGERL
ncbi:MAG TPA: hypothetical protein VIU63_09505 [Nitrospira sp.]